MGDIGSALGDPETSGNYLESLKLDFYKATFWIGE